MEADSEVRGAFVSQLRGGVMSKINVIVESLKTTNYLIAAAAVAGTVMMPIPPVRAADAGMQTAAVSLPKSKPLRMRTSAHAPLDLAAVARMAPPEVVAKAKELAASDTIGILTKQQIVEFARSNPGFVAKLQHAYLTGTLPQLSAEESRIVQAMSDAALGNMKAGDIPSSINIGGISPPPSSGGIGPAQPGTSDDHAGRDFAFLAVIIGLLIIGAIIAAVACGPDTEIGSACYNLREMFGMRNNNIPGVAPIRYPPRAF
jgi:hypothetical protein